MGVQSSSKPRVAWPIDDVKAVDGVLSSGEWWRHEAASSSARCGGCSVYGGRRVAGIGTDPRRDAEIRDRRDDKHARYDDARRHARVVRPQHERLRPSLQLRPQEGGRELGIRSRHDPRRAGQVLQHQPGQQGYHHHPAPGRDLARRHAGDGRGREVVARQARHGKVAGGAAVHHRLADQRRPVQDRRSADRDGDARQARPPGLGKPLRLLRHHDQQQAGEEERHGRRSVGDGVDEDEHGGQRRLYHREPQAR